ncbi:hypothetical protein [Acinetobacter sp. TGL-Y2]|uniref:hypothetical protein n=1 Tax=Acinetobacter sp. TGL-Y2 TaxID=1407071 RepID=UPI000A8731CE|nr:hypothetical protein [Acinetobacter sp. TGL-Y2]
MSFTQYLSTLLKCALISFVVAMPIIYANANVTASPAILTEQEIQQGLLNMKNKMNQRIEQWGNALNRQDFDRVRGKMQLKAAKQLEVCAIFQEVIDETYLAAQANKHRLTDADQRVLSSRTDFINALGFKHNVVQTELGFDCRMK